jgi:crotonobetaine/carnitine-CoA ligase
MSAMSIPIKDKRSPFETLPQLLRMRAQTHGELAFTICGERLSFAELDRRSDDLARGLAARGITKGDRVATLMANRSEQAIVWFATAKLGAIVAPFNVSLGPTDLTHTIKDVGPALLIADERGLGSFGALDAAVRTAVALAVVGVPPIRGAIPFEELYRGSGSVPSHSPAPGDACCILFTGGTTGLPKGVLLSHFYYVVSGYRWAEAFRVTSHDHHYSVLQFYHIGVQSNAIVAPLVNGYSSTIDRWFSVSNYWQRVRETGATLIDPMGTMFTLLFQQPPSATDKMHKVRAAWGASAMLPPGVASGFAERFGIHLVPVFGGTEIGGSAVVHTPIGSHHREGTCGRANGWCEIRVVDENDCPLPTGVVGQIVARPTIPFSMMNGYHNNLVRTVECWRNLWFHTGDLGSLDEDGYLSFVGRQAHWLRRRAENISAYEVEATISEMPDVEEVVVVGVPSELGEDEVKAFVRVHAGASVPPESIVAWCAARLARFKVPRFVEFVASFPRSAAKQEIERHKLKAMPNDNAWDSQRSTGRGTK